MGAIVPFHRTGSGGGPRARASGRVECVLHPAASLTGDYEPRKPALDHSLSRGQGPLKGHPTPPDSEVLRQTRQHIAEAWRLKAESAAIRRRYEERQRKIEELMDGLGI